MKKSYKSKFKISAPTWNEEFGLPDNILYQVFKTILSISLKNGTVTDNPSIRIYVNKIENRTAFKMKTVYYLELLTSETMKLLGSTKDNYGYKCSKSASFRNY